MKYISNAESEKCSKITNVFNELFIDTDIAVVNAGQYGFVLLKGFDYDGFYNISTYMESKLFFNALWEEWLKEKLLSLCIDTPLINLDYGDMYNKLPPESQKAISDKKRAFLLSVNAQTISQNSTIQKSYITSTERNHCRIIADLFRKDLGKNDILIEETEKFGFIMLEYFEPQKNFDSAIVFNDCQKMFDFLLEEWFTCQITKIMNEKHVKNIDIDEFYKELSEQEKSKLEKIKSDFIKQIMQRADFLKY